MYPCSAGKRRDVNYLVTQHGGQLGFVLQMEQQTAVDGHLAAGQRPGVGHIIIQHHDFIGQIGASSGIRQFTNDTADIEIEFRVHHIAAPLRLLAGHIVLASQRYVLVDTLQHQLLLAGNRIDGAAHQAGAQE
jgi:hypothetical protein